MKFIFYFVFVLLDCANAKISQINTKHMQLARVSNGIHLLIKLVDSEFDSDRTIVGSSALKNITTISEDHNGVQLLANHVNSVPLHSISASDITGVTNGLALLAQVENIRKSVEEAAKFTKIPAFIADSAKVLDISELSEDPINALYNYMVILETKTQFTPRYKMEFNTHSATSISMLSVFKKDIILGYLNIPAEDRSLEPVVVGFAAAESLKNATTTIDAFPNQLASLNTMFDGFNLFLDPKLRGSELEKTLRSWEDAIYQLTIPSQKKSAASTFVADQKIGAISEDVRSVIVKQLIGTRKDVVDAIDVFNQFGREVDSFGDVFNKLQPEQSTERLVRLVNFVQSMAAFQEESSKTDASIQKLRTPCLTITVPSAPTSHADLTNFITALDNLSNELQKYVDGFNKVTALAEFQNNIAKLSKLRTDALVMSKTTFDAWKKSQDFLDVKKFLLGLNDTMGVWKIDKALVATLKDQTKVLGWIDEAKQWLGTITVVNTCTFVPEDTAHLIALSKFADHLNQVKTEGVMKKVDEVRQRINETVQALDMVRKAGEVLRADKTATRVAKKYKAQTDHFLTIATAIGSFGQLAKLQTMKEEMEVIRSGRHAINTYIGQVEDLEVKNQLEVVWSNFSTLEVQITDLEKKFNELESNILEREKKVTSETELQQLEDFYIEAARIQFSGTFDIREFVSSLHHFKNPNQKVQAIISAFEKLAVVQFIDLDLAHASFREMPRALAGVKAAFEEAPQPVYIANLKSSKLEDPLNIIFNTGFVIMISVVIATVVLSCYKHCYNKKPENHIVYKDPEFSKYTYVRVQDMRLEANQQDADTQHTELYEAVLLKNWPRVRLLLDLGALVDVVCGVKCRTALMQTAVEGDAEHSRWLLEKGADMNVHTGKGYYPEFIGGKNGLKELFDEFKGKTVIRKLPEVPRLYKILVLDPTVLSKSGRRKLPKVIRKNIDWGLKKVTSPNLNQYTHIVIPKKNIPSMRTLLLEEDDVFMWKCLASMANLMDPNWFKYMITDLKVIEQEQNQMLQHIQFNGKVHLESLLKLKTDFHRGMPGFLTDVSVFFLPKKNQSELKKQEEWKEVIHMLNGTIATEISPNEKGVGPYHTMSPSYRKNIGKQNKRWIIKYEDSIIDPIWRSDSSKYTLVPFRFVTESIAHALILPTTNKIVPLDCVKIVETRKSKKSTKSVK